MNDPLSQVPLIDYNCFKNLQKKNIKKFIGLFLISSEVRYMQLYENPFCFASWMYAAFSCFIGVEISSHSFLIFICNSLLSKGKQLTFQMRAYYYKKIQIQQYRHSFSGHCHSASILQVGIVGRWLRDLFFIFLNCQLVRYL